LRQIFQTDSYFQFFFKSGLHVFYFSLLFRLLVGKTKGVRSQNVMKMSDSDMFSKNQTGLKILKSNFRSSISKTDFAGLGTVFSARQHICYSALYVIAHPSVRPSHGWISQTWLKLGSRNLHHTVAP